jgi:hypothetical protein
MVYSKRSAKTYKHPSQVLNSGWQDAVQGDTIRINCDSPQCEDKINPALTITRTSDGCVYNCYRCGRSGAIKTHRSPGQALNKIKELRDERRTFVDNPNLYTLALPKDFTNLIATTSNDIPAGAYAWIYKYELSNRDIWEYNIGYSKQLERVIIPIYEKNKDNLYKLIAWQGRDVFYDKNVKLYETGKLKRKPLKYYTEYLKEINYNNKLYFKIINNKNNKLINKIINKYNNKLYINKYYKIILVEDILSAIKVYNKYKYNTVALLNSSVHDGLVKDLELYKYKHVILWLDYDARIKAMKYVLKLKQLGIPARTHVTTCDPKAVPYMQMKDL